MDRQAAQEAIEQQDAEALERALEGDSYEGADAEFLHAAAGVLMAGRKWEKAARVLEGLAAEDVGGRMKGILCRNLAAMREHRPGVYEQLIGMGADDRYSVVASATGHPTVLYRHGGRQVVLSPNHRPLEGLKQVVENLKRPYAAGDAMALLGLGDGYFLYHIARHPPKLLMDGEQVIYVIEPDAHAVLACLMMHDYAGARGPIEQRRFQWFVGEGWQEGLERRLLGDAMLPLPGVNISLGVKAAEVGAGVAAATRAAVGVNERLQERVGGIYEGFEGGEVALKLRRMLEEPSPRPSPCVQGGGGRPRVVLITTRFTTVLQYSTADVAEALEGFGFEVRVIIEPSAYHRLSKIAIRQVLAEFRPDLVMQLDHLRQEYGDLFPPELPFVCWGQDHLPNLKNAAAGRKLTAVDFLLTDAVPTYVNAFGYPRRQCIALAKLTKPSPRPSRCVQGEGEVVSFVSNASHDPQRLLGRQLEELKATPHLRELFGECGRRILGVYERGGCLPTFVAVRECVQLAQREMGLAASPEEVEGVASWLAHPFNDALYRQQVLVWAAEAAEELSISLGLYGKGWEDHPKLGRYARGPVAYGEELAKLTRGTRLNLQVVPFPCVHQRLLDGVLAGGFFLIREHPVDRVMPALADFLHQRGLREQWHTEQVLAKLEGVDRERFLVLAQAAAACTKTSELDDPVEMVRCFEEARLVVAGEPIVPGFDEVAFDSAHVLRERIVRFLNDPEAAGRIVQQQARSIAERFTYNAGMRRVLGRIGQLLSEKPAGIHGGLAA